MPKFLPYNPKLKEKARQLRKNSTLAEILLWQRLKRKQLKGYDFHRQKPIGNYIVDFFCPQLMLAIEIDGSTHEGKEQYDIKKQKQLERLGIHFLRFGDHQVKINLEGVIIEIENWIAKNKKLPS
jgi:very-short-patch-repair endonuclease